MKLCTLPSSPYGRKVMVSAFEMGLADDIECVDKDPRDPETDLAAFNPLGEVPALIRDDGTVLIDSSAICAYLDTLHDGARLVPDTEVARLHMRQTEALANGLTVATILRLRESRRPEHLRWPEEDARQRQKCDRVLDALEREAGVRLRPPLTLGHIAVGCALEFLDFGFPAEDWRAGRAELAQWFSGLGARPSMQATTLQPWT